MGDQKVANYADKSFLNAQIEAANLELEALCDLVAEVPALMEARCKLRLQRQLLLNRRLLDEQVELLALFKSMHSPIVSGQETIKSPFMNWENNFLRSAGWERYILLVRELFLNLQNSSSGSLKLALGAVLSLLAAAITCSIYVNRKDTLDVSPAQAGKSVGAPYALEASQKSSILSLVVNASSDSLVELHAIDSTWVEVADVEGLPLLHDTLSAGDRRRIRLRSGLEIYAARPEQLRFRVDNGAWQLWPNHFLNSGLVLLTPSQQPAHLEGNR